MLYIKIMFQIFSHYFSNVFYCGSLQLIKKNQNKLKLLLRLHSNLTFSNSSKYLSLLWSASANSISLCFSITCNMSRKVRQQVNYIKQRLLPPVFQIRSVFAHVFCWTSKRFVNLWSDIEIYSSQLYRQVKHQKESMGNGRKTHQPVTGIMKSFCLCSYCLMLQL